MKCRIINADMRAILQNTVMMYLIIIIPESFSWKERKVIWKQESNVSLFTVLYKDNQQSGLNWNFSFQRKCKMALIMLDPA